MAGTESNSHGGHPASTEPAGVATGVVLRFAAVLAVVSVVCMGLVAGVFFFLERRTEATEARPMPVETEHPATADERLPPEPRLEIDPKAGLAALQAAEKERLETYGWVDKPNGVVRIPIERAMALMVEKEKK